MDELVFVRHIHNPTVHRESCSLYDPTYAKPVTEEKARQKGYLFCPTCLPGVT